MDPLIKVEDIHKIYNPGENEVRALDGIESTLQSMGMSVPTISYILTLIGGIIMIVAGILGIMHKCKQSILYAVVILLVYYLGIFIYNTLSIGLAPLNLLSFLLPLLYAWGWYQSED